MKKKVVIVVSLIVAVLLAVFYLKKNGQFVPVKTGKVVDAVYALGTVKPLIYYNLRMGNNSAISRIYVVEGSSVNKGDPLLSTSDMITMRSPISGTVTSVNFKENELVSTNANVLSVIDMKKLYVQISLDQESVLRIKKNQTAEVSFEMLRDKKVNGRVSAVFPSDGEFLVNIALDSVPEEILPEMTCDVAVKIAVRDNAMMIPSSAVTNEGVVVLRGGKKIPLKPKTQMIDAEWVEVTDGSILPNDKVLNVSKSVKKRK
ncbi:MAG TPA: HlyD family efflux transporter periplasmic adaptor subunit [Spirochaetota bacterium]|nr:HlyD family efflux transporter periplasmic adaptor subunit [Spirochaetota bacterium]HOR43947.1 HlyD family efflux transporter periplasmic adaptor subunit [Spirochaetota bacterium]HOU85043.1 HlyD family efflux transporter periplasmic adaptor subunit [Spirochaetota bacterium]HPK55371.1 HlyD family efflux transporter periplasmic adaptor subunit [Spirochaetota bacterium]HQE59028.1 HlyD family efflux transporter periplasmic adaptor subunit [Spirochaetota bacterium]